MGAVISTVVLFLFEGAERHRFQVKGMEYRISRLAAGFFYRVPF